MPTISACTIHTKSHWTTRWFARGFGGLFLYTSVTLSERVTLQKTPVVKLIQQEYPTVTSFLVDLFIPLAVLGGLFLFFSLLLRYSKHLVVSKKLQNRLKRWDEKMLRGLLSWSFFLVHWTIILGITLVLWFTLIQWITTLVPTKLNFPSFEQQIVVALLGIAGLAVLLNSFDWWQTQLAKRWCLRCHV